MTERGLKDLGRRLGLAVIHPMTVIGALVVVLLATDVERRVVIAALVVLLLGGAVRSILFPAKDAPPPALPDQASFDAYLDKILRAGERARSACLLLRPNDVESRHKMRSPVHPDRTIERLAEQIRPVLRDDDFIARLQGDTIAIALSNRTALNIESVIQVALRLQRRIDMPVETGKPLLATGVRVGIALSTRDDSAEQLRLRANHALDGAGPGAIRCASGETPDRGALAVDLARDLPAAFDSGEMIAHFQPQVCTDTGRLTGVEALARWQHPQHGLLLPGQFLEICEAADLMGELTETIVRDALAALADWDRAGLDVPRVSVNFTLRDLSDPNLVDRLRWILDATNVEPGRLGVEVLESVLCGRGDGTVSRTLETLRKMGCFIDLDDFGTGSASITNIRRFAIERLKIDRSFVRGVDHDLEQRNMVAAILTMAEQLDIDSLAEGIETPEEFAMLAQLGCHHVQGFGVGRPMPRAQIPKWMAERAPTEMAQHLPEILSRIPTGTGASITGVSPIHGSPERKPGPPPPEEGQGKTA